MPAGGHGGDRGRPQGIACRHGWVSRKHSELDRASRGSAAAWLDDSSQAGNGRWRHGFLGSVTRGLSRDARATLLGAQEANVLNNMPKSVQPRAKADLHEIWMAETRELAQKAYETFLAKYQAKYEAACECLRKDREQLLTFYDFPAEHWIHLRTTNPIESTFATIRLRHRRTKGNGTRKASLAMMFKLAQAAQKKWQRLHGSEQLPLLLQGRIFVDGMLQDAA